ncbi:MAG: helix-turn-helix transcriptional regulator [Opitutaceae bacterium]
MKRRKIRNLIGPQIRRLRTAKGWSQEHLMVALQEIGWNICRQRIARLEACEAWVSDFEMLLLAQALGIEIPELFPKIEDKRQPLYSVLSHLLCDQVKTIMSPDDILLDRSVRCCLAFDLAHKK